MLKVNQPLPREISAGSLVEPCDPAIDLEAAFARLARRPHCVFFDSARRDAELGRYSFLAADPFEYLELPVDSHSPLDELAGRMTAWETATIEGLPPFQGGAAGLFSYDLGRSIEQVSRPRFDEFGMPAIAIGFYDVVLAVDHVEGEAWIISQGFPEIEPAARRRRARERIDQFRSWLSGPAIDPQPAPRDFAATRRAGALPCDAGTARPAEQLRAA